MEDLTIEVQAEEAQQSFVVLNQPIQVEIEKTNSSGTLLGGAILQLVRKSDGEVIREWFDKLGTQIRSCHAKDIILGGRLTVHLDECRPGLGALDYETYLKCMSKLDDRTCMMLEHMTEEIDYIEATKYIKGLAKKLNIAL